MDLHSLVDCQALVSLQISLAKPVKGRPKWTDERNRSWQERAWMNIRGWTLARLQNAEVAGKIACQPKDWRNYVSWAHPFENIWHSQIEVGRWKKTNKIRSPVSPNGPELTSGTVPERGEQIIEDSSSERPGLGFEQPPRELGPQPTPIVGLLVQMLGGAAETGSAACKKILGSASDFGKAFKNRVRTLERERPMQLLALVGIASLALGIAARGWGSRRGWSCPSPRFWADRRRLEKPDSAVSANSSGDTESRDAGKGSGSKTGRSALWGCAVIGGHVVFSPHSFLSDTSRSIVSNNPYRWFLGFAVVGVVWLVAGVVTVLRASRAFDLKRSIPTKTIEVLKGDKLWIENETKNNYERRAD